MTRLEFEREIYSDIVGKDIKGFPLYEDYAFLFNETEDAIIHIGMEYRPDKIAEYYLGDSRLAWVITYLNKFSNGIRDYTLGKKIKIPKLS